MNSMQNKLFEGLSAKMDFSIKEAKFDQYAVAQPLNYNNALVDKAVESFDIQGEVLKNYSRCSAIRYTIKQTGQAFSSAFTIFSALFQGLDQKELESRVYIATYTALRDLQEAFGWLRSVFGPEKGLKTVAKAITMKKMYSHQHSNAKIDNSNPFYKQAIDKIIEYHNNPSVKVSGLKNIETYKNFYESKKDISDRLSESSITRGKNTFITEEATMTIEFTFEKVGLIPFVTYSDRNGENKCSFAVREHLKSSSNN